MKLLKEQKGKELAELVLAMLLEHITQFSEILGLTPEFVKQSQLQELVRLLPYRLAIIMMILYTTANPIEAMKYMDEETDPDIISGIIAACLTSFYQEINKLK